MSGERMFVQTPVVCVLLHDCLHPSLFTLPASGKEESFAPVAPEEDRPPDGSPDNDALSGGK
jgi:hypothetical protein